MAWQHAPIALIPVVMFAGCGGGSSAHQSANTPGGTTAASTQQARAPQTAAQIAQERAIGSRALLRLSDFPTGWTAGEREGGSSQAAQLRREVAACMHVPVSQLDENDPAEVKSPKFKGPESEEIGNTVVVRPTAEAAVSYFSVFDAAQTPACLTSATRTVFARKLKEAGKVPAAVEVGSPTVERMSFPSFGDQSIAYRISVPVSSSSISQTVSLDAVVIRIGRATTSLTFFGPSSPVSTSTEESLTNVTTRRLDDALRSANPT